MTVADWRGKLFFFGDSLLYAGPVGPTQRHRHHALQVVLSLAEPIEMHGGNTTSAVSATSIVTDPDVEHAITRGSTAALLLYVDPDTALGKRFAVGSAPAEPASWVARGKQLEASIPSSLPATWADAATVLRGVVEVLGVPRDRTRITHPAIARARRYIEHSLDGDVRAEAVANAAGVSPSRLSQVLASNVGVPLRRYVRWSRLRAAADSLRDGATLSAAAAEAGFADGAHLTRTFREMFGIAPSEIMLAAEWVRP